MLEALTPQPGYSPYLSRRCVYPPYGGDAFMGDVCHEIRASGICDVCQGSGENASDMQ